MMNFHGVSVRSIITAADAAEAFSKDRMALTLLMHAESSAFVR